MTVLDSRARFQTPAPKRRILRRWWWVLAVAGVLAVVAWVVGWSPLLSVSQVQVVGNHTVSAADIRAAAGVALGTPLVRVNSDAVSARVEALAAIKSVDVRHGWPGTLILDVTERTPIAVMAVSGGFDLVAADNVAYATVGTRPGGLTLLAATAPDVRAAAIAMLAAVPVAFRSQSNTLTGSTPDDLRLVLRDGTQVRWGGSNNSARKAAVVMALLPQRVAVIDVSAPGLPTTKGTLKA
jgi:cell division protein FtsQ